MSTEITTLGVKVTQKGAGKAKKEINSIGVVASKVKSKIGLLSGALAALGVGKLLKDSIKYTASIEDLGIQLKFLTGSTKSASKAFAEMTKFASETPFALKEIQQSSASLLVAVGNDVSKLGNMLQITGEIASQFGLSFQVTAGQLQRAMSAGAASADIFREKGVNAMMGFRVGVKTSVEDTQKIIMKWAEDNKGAIDELKDTFTGKVSMMGDAWNNLLLAFGEAGALDDAKNAVQSMTKTLKDPETIKLMERLGSAVGELVLGLEKTVSFMVRIAVAINTNNLAEAEAVKIAIQKIKAEEDLLRIKRKLKDMTFGELKVHTDTEFAMKELRKSMAMSADFAKSERARVKEAEEAKKLKKRQELGVDKTILKVFNITEKLTKKRTELQKITDAQITAEKILGTQLKNSKITLEQYTHGIDMMKTEIQNYADVIEQIAFDKKMEKMAQSMEDSITDSLMNMGQGLDSFKDLATSIFRDIAAEMVRVQIARPLAQAGSAFLGDMFGSMFGAPAGAPAGAGAGGGAGLPHATFAGGGFTGSGSRSGGVDNQGGFPAILHPNETVIDHSKGQKTGGDTNIVVNYSPQVNALDPRTAATVIAENAPMVVGIIRQAFNRNGQSVAI
jgi:phage tail tape-measure protein